LLLRTLWQTLKYSTKKTEITKHVVEVELTKWDSSKLFYFICRLCRFLVGSFVCFILRAFLLVSILEAFQASTQRFGGCWYLYEGRAHNQLSLLQIVFLFWGGVFDSRSYSNISKPEATPCPIIMNILRSSFIYP